MKTRARFFEIERRSFTFNVRISEKHTVKVYIYVRKNTVENA